MYMEMFDVRDENQSVVHSSFQFIESFGATISCRTPLSTYWVLIKCVDHEMQCAKSVVCFITSWPKEIS